MAIQATHKEVNFGVGDVVNLYQTIVETGKDKTRTQVFQGTVIKIKGRDMGKSITLRRISAQNIGIEFIMPLASPLLEKVEVVREGKKGSRHAKLYYIRNKSKKEIETIFSRAKRRKEDEVKKEVRPEPKKPAKKVSSKPSQKAPKKS